MHNRDHSRGYLFICIMNNLDINDLFIRSMNWIESIGGNSLPSGCDEVISLWYSVLITERLNDSYFILLP